MLRDDFPHCFVQEVGNPHARQRLSKILIWRGISLVLVRVISWIAFFRSVTGDPRNHTN